MTNAFINSHVVTMAVVRRIILMAYPECTPEALPGENLLVDPHSKYGSTFIT
jgi:hypothetical protein